MNFSPSAVKGFPVLTGTGEPNKRAENSRPPADGLPDGKIIGGSTTMNRESAYELDKKYLTQQEVADLFRVKPGTVKNWREAGYLDYFQVPGSSRVLYPAETINQFEREHTKKAKVILKNRALYGDIRTPQEIQNENPQFGEQAEKWYRIRSKQIKASTMRDYRSSMNLHILPKLGNRSIKEITYLEIEEFKAGLEVSTKRINNILVPMRSVFTMAFKEGIIRDNVMARVNNLRIEEPTINPLSLDEFIKVLECVHPHYRNCLTVLFFTGLRFGEMAALNRHLKRQELNTGP
jgi:hypothetical protein